MALADILHPDGIIPALRVQSKKQLLMELATAASKLTGIPEREIFDVVLQREKLGSTSVGGGIAIPHASSDRVSKVVAAFSRSSKGNEFDALDNAPVRFVVLFVVPKDQFQTHLRTLAAIAKFLNDRGVRERLGTAGSAAEILGIFESSGR